MTGASGFIGHACLAALLDRGFEVHAVTSKAPPADERAALTWHRADLLDTAAVHALVTEVRPSHVLHAAWETTPGQYGSSPINVQWVRASLALLDAFAGAGGTRFVTVGSCFEYDLRHGFCSEDVTPLVASSVYGRAKNAVRPLIDDYATAAGISSGWGRVFYVYGPREHPTRLVASVATALLRGEPAPCSHGNQVRDYLHVDDVGDALAALTASEVTEPVNIGSGEAVRLRDLIDGVARRLGGEDLVRLGEVAVPADEPPLIVADVRRLSELLGWYPRYDLENGLDQTVDWWSRHLRDRGAA